jgi:hypothetical protein
VYKNEDEKTESLIKELKFADQMIKHLLDTAELYMNENKVEHSAMCMHYAAVNFADHVEEVILRGLKTDADRLQCINEFKRSYIERKDKLQKVVMNASH